MITIQEEIFNASKKNEIILAELVFTYANASLDFSRHHQMQAIECLIKKCDTFRKQNADDENIIVAQSFVLRNYSILLSEVKRYNKSFATIDRLQR